MNIREIVASWKERVVTSAMNWLGQFLPKPSFQELAWCVAEFEVLSYDALPNGKPDFSRPRPELTQRGRNIVVDDGRKQVLKHILNITSPAAPVNFPYLGVGSGVTAAAATDTTLQTELTGNANRKTLLNTNDLAFTDTDIAFEVSGSFRWKVIAQATYDAGDGNNSSVFAEYAIFSTNVFATGKMYNRFVHPSPFTKTASLAVVVKMTLRA